MNKIAKAARNVRPSTVRSGAMDNGRAAFPFSGAPGSTGCIVAFAYSCPKWATTLPGLTVLMARCESGASCSRPPTNIAASATPRARAGKWPPADARSPSTPTTTCGRLAQCPHRLAAILRTVGLRAVLDHGDAAGQGENGAPSMGWIGYSMTTRCRALASVTAAMGIFRSRLTKRPSRCTASARR